MTSKTNGYEGMLGFLQKYVEIKFEICNLAVQENGKDHGECEEVKIPVPWGHISGE